ncbi:MAG: 5-carboxymethyl-2-hydroxymuconate Delta-isomerase [Pseudobdellovibrionaceae bacterium]
MPHITLEYSESLKGHFELHTLLRRMHEELASFPTVDKHKIKTRAVALTDCIVGNDDDPDQMMHVTVKLLEGRSVELRRTIGEALQKVVKSHLLSDLYCSVTVHILEMDRETYAE